METLRQNIPTSQSIRSLSMTILVLSATQILSWGTLFFGFALLLPAIQQRAGVRDGLVSIEYSVGLFIAAAGTFFAGVCLRYLSARTVMTFGSCLAGVSLALLAQSPMGYLRLLSLCMLGMSTGFVFYDTAFSVVALISPIHYRTAITLITLIGGLSSTIFWPLTRWLLDNIGLVVTLQVFAAINILVSAPLHALFLPPIRAEERKKRASTLFTEVSSLLQLSFFRMLAASYALNAIVFSVLALYLIPYLQWSGMKPAQATYVAAFIGPAQIGGRLLLLKGGYKWTAKQAGILSMVSLPTSLLILFFGRASLALGVTFASAYGVSNGIVTIVRGLSVIDHFGPERYSVVSGCLAGTALLARATGPFIASLLLRVTGTYRTLFFGTLLLALGSLLCFWRAYSRHE
jgi:predicted MFS family arabinose efflux permease